MSTEALITKPASGHWTDAPFYVSIAIAARWLQSFELPAGFEVVMPADKPLDPVGEPEVTREILQNMALGGTTILSARFIHHSLAHYLEQIHALAELNEDPHDR
jgi:hypothetical protein